MKQSVFIDKTKVIFSFLEKDFDMKLIEILPNERVVFIYKNSFVQVEFCIGNSVFHAEIRQIINGELKPYSNSHHNISFEDLAILESNHNYEHMDYFAGSSGGLKKVIKNSVALFKRHKSLFTSDNWVNTVKIKELKDKDFEETFNIKPTNAPSLIDIVDTNIKSQMKINGYKKTKDSRELPPYSEDKIWERLAYSNGSKEISIAVQDWRDEYYIYNIKVGSKKVKRVDILKLGGTVKAGEFIVNFIKSI
jgi:hypothetical protein